MCFNRSGIGIVLFVAPVLLEMVFLVFFLEDEGRLMELRYGIDISKKTPCLGAIYLKPIIRGS